MNKIDYICDQSNVFVVGASQGIGFGFVKQLLSNNQVSKIYATYRNSETALELLDLAANNPDRLICLKMDVTDESSIIQSITAISSQIKKLHLVIYCVGLLHQGELQPEKSLRQINTENLLNYFQVNSIGAILLAKHLMSLLRHKEGSIFASISAKVGSIGDNRLGGWYGYRASKAALNMFLKTISIEYNRRCPKTIVVALHPGTTNTRLSKPFQKNVPPGKLFPVEKTVNLLLDVIASLKLSDSGEFFSWDGSKLPW
ncbi:MAG: SDR family NAD(P)-dependent oxidoreductase [Cyanobacteria bacterium P01_F01_bin.143]